MNSTCNNIDFNSDRIFFCILYGFIFCIGLPVNCLAVFGLYRLVKSENGLPIYVINLLLSDILQIFTLPLWIHYYSYGHQWYFGATSCKIMGCIFYISLYASIFFLCCIALERYLAIAHPLKFPAIRRLWFACLLSLSLWTFITIIPAVAFKVLFPESNNSLCIEKYPSKKNFIAYRIITLILSFFFPLAFLLFMYRGTLRSLSHVQSVNKSEKKRIRGLLSLLVLIFLLVFGPYHLTGCVKYIGLVFSSDICEFEARIFIFYQVGRGFLSLNSLLDPILYIFLRMDFQKQVLYFFPCCQKFFSLIGSKSEAEPNGTIRMSEHTDSTGRSL
ncbi:G-protein coupled receptor 4-like [Polypterus senegalus]|uniref:G-protein coupled receptor 4-like n=1 Tax=Polypterus senegalus TaxID=55291 RepID=UPI00196464EB|nr:G-protein coupled receptor 4-like [Polypterus senegalus]XP_039602000.1 G-protein coupled receptor 4-like [Polypterus senegalus]